MFYCSVISTKLEKIQSKYLKLIKLNSHFIFLQLLTGLFRVQPKLPREFLRDHTIFTSEPIFQRCSARTKNQLFSGPGKVEMILGECGSPLSSPARIYFPLKTLSFFKFCCLFFFFFSPPRFCLLSSSAKEKSGCSAGGGHELYVHPQKNGDLPPPDPIRPSPTRPETPSSRSDPTS